MKIDKGYVIYVLTVPTLLIIGGYDFVMWWNR